MRRINLKVLVGTVLAAVLMVTGVHFLHAFQLKRNAGSLLDQAQREETDGNLIAALDYYGRYLTYRPDDMEAAVKRVLLLADLALKGNRFVDLQNAVTACDAVLRESPDKDNVRRKSVSLKLALRRFPDALVQINELIESLPGDAELYDLKGICLQSAKDLVKAETAYKKSIELNPKRVDPYVLLAQMLRDSSENRREEADRWIDRMVENNADQFEAYLTRLTYHQIGASDTLAQKEWTKSDSSDLKKARELAPEEKRVLVASAREANARGDLTAAKSYLEKGFELHPKDPLFFTLLSELESTNKQSEKALEWLRKGLKSDPPNSWITKFRIALLLTDMGKGEQAAEEIEALEKSPAPQLCTFLKGRTAFQEKNWLKASYIFESIRPQLDFPATVEGLGFIPTEADVMLAKCYEHLNEWDRQLDVSRRLAKANSNSVVSLLELARAEERLGKVDDALVHYTNLAEKNAIYHVDVARLLLRRQFRAVAGRSPAEQAKFWKELESHVTVAELAGANPVGILTFRIDLMMAQSLLLARKLPETAKQMRDEARRLVEQSRDLFDNQQSYWMTLVRVVERQGDYESAASLLKDAQKQGGESVVLRLEQARLLIREHLNKDTKEAAEKELASLETNLQSFTPESQIQLLSGLAEVHERVADSKGATRLWTKVAEIGESIGSSDALTSRIRLFDLALTANDDRAMSEIIEKIKKLEGEQEGPMWRYAEATRLALTVSKKDAADQLTDHERDVLKDARKLLTEAATRRPSWSRLPLLNGLIHDRSGEEAQALEEYLKAIDLDELRPPVIERTVQLLDKFNRSTEAEQLLRNYEDRDGIITLNLARVGTETAIKAGDKARARQLALQSVLFNSKDAKEFVWVAEKLAIVGAPRKEIESVLLLARRADEKEPLVWRRLVEFYRNQGIEESEAIFREAETKLQELKSHSVLGECYELMDRVNDAEKQYLIYVDEQPLDGKRVEWLALFYQRYGQIAKAKPYLKRLLEDAKIETTPEIQKDARRLMALALLAEGGYANYLEGKRLVETNRKISSYSIEDKRVLSMLLATRPEERLEALKLLQDLAKQQKLTLEDEFRMAQLLDASQDWPRAQSALLHILGIQPTNPTALAYYINGLIRQQDYPQAAAWLNRLEKVYPNAAETVALKVQLWKAEKQFGAAEDWLIKRSKMENAGLGQIGRLLEEIDRPQAAEEVYRKLVVQAKNPRAQLLLAQFLGRVKRLKEAMSWCEKARADCPVDLVAQSTVAILRATKNEPDHAIYLKEAKVWLEAASQKSPSPTILCSLADVLDLSGDFDQASAAWRAVLAKDSSNLMALNNLACLLAYRQDQGMEGLELINKALEKYGPAAELLDTQGMVYIARKEAKLAIPALVQATQLNPSPSKQFHLAQAHRLDNDDKNAARAWQEALKGKLKIDNLHPLERPAFTELQNALGSR